MNEYQVGDYVYCKFIFFHDIYEFIAKITRVHPRENSYDMYIYEVDIIKSYSDGNEILDIVRDEEIVKKLEGCELIAYLL